VFVVAWAEFEQRAPSIAAVAERLWPGIVALRRGEPATASPSFSVAYLATVRVDGSPRLHPFCPILAGAGLFAAIPSASPKGRDLRRDARCVIHALPGPDDDELCIRARAREVIDSLTRDLVISVVRRSRVGGMIQSVSEDPIFEFDIERVDAARWIDIGQPGTHAERERWPLT
jgi:hypothetical protein